MRMLGNGMLPQISGSFSPDAVANLLLWLDAMDANSAFTDTGMTTAATNGQAVKAWRDKSGNNNNATQSATISAPTKISNGIQMDGVNDYLATPPISEGNQFTVFCAFTPQDITTTWRIFLGHETYNANIGWFLWTSAANTVTYSQPSGFSSTTPNDTTKKVLAFGKDGSTGYLYKNGVLASSASQPSYNQSNVSLTIGCRHSNDGASVNDFALAAFHEILIFSRWLSLNERNLINNYLTTKWSV